MILITGATGFIGKHLVNAMSKTTSIPIRALTRQSFTRSDSYGGIEYIQGDITDKSSLDALIEPGATLINLAFSNATAAADAIAVTADLVEICAKKGIKRLIHCSSISVYGRVNGVVTEQTQCVPHDEYGRIKRAVEQTLLDNTQGRFELVILRPSEVFGIGGKALVSLMDSLLTGNKVINYARSSLFSRRRTHLVPVETVVDAIRFICADKRIYEAETFIISADNEPLNNFQDIERLLIDELGLSQYPIPPVTIPRFVLENILLATGRSTIDSQVVYSTQKLKDSGFCNNHNLEHALKQYAKIYKTKKFPGVID